MNNLKDKALDYIERLCLSYEDGDKKNLENTQKIIDNIYRFAHCVNKKRTCYNIHKNWRKELEETNWKLYD